MLPDKEGKPYTVRYDAVNAMLLNEFLKEHRKTVKNRNKTIEKLKFEALRNGERTGIANPKVSAQLKASKPAPQVVNNP